MVKEKVSNKVFLNKPEVQVLLLIIIEIIKLIKEKKEAINNKKIFTANNHQFHQHTKILKY